MSDSMPPAVDAYPVAYDVEPQLTERNRLTCFFRWLLAIPHYVLVGSPGGGGSFSSLGDSTLESIIGLVFTGVLNLVAGVMAVISWFAIVLTGKQPRGLWDFSVFVLGWQSRAFAYTALLRDEYPPFGEGEYPVTFSSGGFPETRNRLTVFLRIFYAIPHAIILLFVGIAWVVTAVIGWFAILFTGSYPAGLYDFAVGYLRWSLRFGAYLLLVRDEYPPFSLK